MSYTLPEAAARLGVSVRDMRGAIRNGALPAPENFGALSTLSNEWLLNAEATTAAKPLRTHRQRVPAFARYEGTSAFRKYPNRVREYNAHKAASERAETSPQAS